MSSVNSLLQLFITAFHEKKLVKLTLGAKRIKAADLKNVFVKPVEIKAGYQLSFIYRHNTKDITKNFGIEEACDTLEKLLAESFFNADLFTLNHHYQLLQQNGKAKMITKPVTNAVSPNRQHDKQKQRIVATENNIYLQQLGITTTDGSVKKDMQDKYKQINRYVEIVEGIIKDITFDEPIHVVDMGSGKGYLTFALYDYLTNKLQLRVQMTGIEMREDLVNTCNSIASNASFTQLHFEKGTIADAVVTGTNILIALHACDTATDDAIYKGIETNAKVIIAAPCCHKQIRKEIRPDNILSAITKHGILLERQAEMVTDAIRSLLLEAFGYKTKVFEFIGTEHTPKNVMIAAVKSKQPVAKELYIEKVKSLKALFNIEQHYLETLLF